jgi:hypothetical protein
MGYWWKARGREIARQTKTKVGGYYHDESSDIG